MEWRQRLTSTALIGTDRQTPQPPEAEDALTTVVKQLDWGQPEQALLGAAGAISLHQQVGRQPMNKALPPLVPCSLDDLPCCSARTARHLVVALTEQREVMSELLELMAVAGQRAPHALLPRLLILGQQTAKLRPQISQALGKRGQWLAAQNPAWAYGRVHTLDDFAPEAPDSQKIWREGDRSERALFLQQWRQVDPDTAREALEAIWSSELAKDRETLIAGLSVQLSMADEPFLEKALSDRAQGVRKLAAGLLVQLPESDLCQRMAQRAQTFVQLQTKGKDFKIDVTLPESCEKDWERDGVNPKPPGKAGKRAGWLTQILASAPLDVWQADPAAAIAPAIADNEWRDLLIQGWGLAAWRQHKLDWVDALISQFSLPEFDPDLLADLLALFPSERREQILRDKLPPLRTKDEDLTSWLYQVAQGSQPWSLDFSRLVLKQLLSLLTTSQTNRYKLFYPVRNMALTLHPDLAPEASEVMLALSQEKHFAYWRNTLNEFLSCLTFRQDIHQAFEDTS
ncbi:MAG: DUF5691 domain-containing protein [Leptolyngbyaceae cyanobacterium MO_188.B28]|nr:DUF5691 domain-containing protein [Leptolyngbyaceae cyanobacterium MO_188.B28]